MIEATPQHRLDCVALVYDDLIKRSDFVLEHQMKVLKRKYLYSLMKECPQKEFDMRLIYLEGKLFNTLNYSERQRRKRKYYKPFSTKPLEKLLPGQVAISEASEEEISEKEDAISEEDDISGDEKSQK
ncbi:hypothetical protein AVEN_33359-1 [Araneus ventricosus]|uniref:Uncharacterized protein n=1 Tax=Araneus ventricosus TaxID=182803 RepID=A0A4Y2J6U2_ARAVE|nr:hypothetical protein AVEN_33359-1 [Araneus ventricosus]